MSACWTPTRSYRPAAVFVRVIQLVAVFLIGSAPLHAQPLVADYIKEVEDARQEMNALYYRGNDTLKEAMDRHGVKWAQRYLDSWPNDISLLWLSDAYPLYRSARESMDNLRSSMRNRPPTPQEREVVAQTMASFRQMHATVQRLMREYVDNMAKQGLEFDKNQAGEAYDAESHRAAMRDIRARIRAMQWKVGAEVPPPPPPGPAVPRSDEPAVATSTDPTTGELKTVRRNEDGSTTTYRGVRRKDADGTERFIETDDKGTRIETAIAPDGTITVTKSTPGQGETRTTTTPDGRVTTVERDASGVTRESTLAEDGSIVTQRRSPSGELTGTIIDRPDGAREHVDRHGNRRTTITDRNGNTTTVTIDRSGNTTTTVVDRDGNVVSRERDLIAIPERGRSYFEQVLGGTDWDYLPQDLKTRYANSERMREETAVRHAEEDAAAKRQKAEDARRAAESATATEQTRKLFDALRAEQDQAERVAAERKARLGRNAEVEKSYETARTLQQQYDAAVARGDKTEATRVLALQDEHHEKSMGVLRHTAEELRAMEQQSDTRSRVAREITAHAHQVAAKGIAEQESLQDTKDTVTSGTKYVSLGSQLQNTTRAATRAAAREKALAQAKQQAIARRLEDPKITAEERAVLRDLQDMAIQQESAAGELLAANGRITAAGYTLDGALLLSGGTALRGGAQGVKTAVTAAGTAVSRRTATQTTTGLAGKTTVTLVENAARTPGLTSGLTAAERQAFLTSRVSASMSQAGTTQVVGVLPRQLATRLQLQVSRQELARLHTAGANLTAAEIVKKAELYAARELARMEGRQVDYRFLNQLINEAQAAARGLR